MPKPIEVFMVRPEKLKRYRGALTDAKKESLQIALHELDKYGRMQVKKLQELAPEKKGLFLSGFTYSLKKSGPNLGELRINWYPKDRPKKLLDWIVFGTGIYGPYSQPIRPRKKKFLAWQNPNTGQWNRRRFVLGMKPRDFVTAAWRELKTARDALTENVGKLIAQKIFDKSARS